MNHSTGRMWRSRNGVRLCVVDFGGSGVPIVLLHGLAGYAGEWADTAGLLSPNFHSVAFDQRGHGRSERDPADLSRDAHVGDVLGVISECFPGQSVVLVGQSLGAHTAMLVAAHHPDVIQALVMIEGSPSGGRPDAVDHIGRWLKSWPRPFRTRSQAAEFFGGGHRGQVWADGLEARAEGLWPRFRDDVVLAALGPAESRTWWSEWQAIRCPILVVVGERGWMDSATVARMAQRQTVTVATVDDAGHDVHLDQPVAVASLIGEWLALVGVSSSARSSPQEAQ